MGHLSSEPRNIELLAGIDDAQLESISAVVSLERLEPGEILVTEGTVGEDLYFVRNGRFSVSIMDGGESATVAQLGAGGRRTATVTALEPCEVLRLPHAEFDRLMISSESLRESVSNVTRHRLREAALRGWMRETWRTMLMSAGATGRMEPGWAAG